MYLYISVVKFVFDVITKKLSLLACCVVLLIARADKVFILGPRADEGIDCGMQF